ncbi:ABC transporter substrate-binding protein [Bacteriovorax sp. Seq25_V]|uniref:substrate-binding periplasmic protein n=1 Tax=Bacteriovorax sp. Seq25_V TaxID=1201288 RepID=UPI00038A12E1|nr:transporter substrate-binding domain-containing protein [Bacteriovorax sp. Seq25_V]EQC44679.1 ABC transporter, substrate-binding protein, family 3 [Bacteriovorax sp. Seq25_V]
MKYLILFFISIASYATSIRISVAEDVASVSPKYLEILNKVYKEVGLDVNFVILPLERTIKEFDEKKFQAMAVKLSGITQISKRAILINPPVIKGYQYGIFALKNSSQSLIKKINIPDHRYILTRGTVYGKLFKKKYPNAHITYAKDYQNAIEQLKRNRADYLVSTEVYLERKEVSKILVMMDDHKEKMDIHHVISPELMYLKPKLEKIFQRLVDDETLSLKNLFKKD